ncbi:ATP-dependent helicase/deoxyribonuclease subunit [Trichinella spiralis]|uniref:ATP-dependent helicase/deoxyribonuclease subunit n=1 Tax=Trichinella spiralis TaxID=6334 RepID=A0ABR3KP12_TRISP
MLYVAVSDESAHSMGKKFERNAENKNGQQVFDEKQLTKKHLPHLRIDCDGNMKTDSCECPLKQCVRLQKHQIERTK